MNRLRVYECPWCPFVGLPAGYWTHECDGMSEALALLGATPADVRKFAVAPAAAAGDAPESRRPPLRLVSPAPSKETQ